jgi:hypothetical protein
VGVVEPERRADGSQHQGKGNAERVMRRERDHDDRNAELG